MKAVEAVPDHVVILPSAGPHRTLRLVTDLDLLLAHTIASVRLNQRMISRRALAYPDLGGLCLRVRPSREVFLQVVDDAF
jgi:hypothetical protein